jgi:hypothetical protein
MIGGAIAAAALVALGLYLYFGTNLIRGPLGPPNQPVAVSRVVLEAAPDGTAISLVLRDASGLDSVFVGQLSIELREPDGAVWQTTTNVNMTNFKTLPPGSLLAGRLGYTLTVPPTAWTRPPRRGGPATVSIGVTPVNGTRFTSSATEIFP